MVVGIPRALHSYQYYPLWHTLLSELGAEPLLSPPTNRDILAAGVAIAPSEICLPVKACLGHIAWLQGRCDAIMIPRAVCFRAGRRLLFGCPKSLALPDLVRSTVSPLPQVLELNLDERIESVAKSYLRLGRTMDTDHRAGPALEHALLRQLEANRALRSGTPFSTVWADTGSTCLPPPVGPQAPVPEPPIPDLRIGVVAHPYLVHDPVLSVGILEKLAQLGVRVLPSTAVPESARFPEPSRAREICWYFEQELLRAAIHFLGTVQVDGLLFVSSFSCGTSAVVNEVITRELSHTGVPMSAILLDEHTAETGVMTRLEAFVDLVGHRRRTSGASRNSPSHSTT
jgi:predicted nucleotide-binding protein (sugar kinase/HSP70/actin superfamily)